jgi:hypothetical protein
MYHDAGAEKNSRRQRKLATNFKKENKAKAKPNQKSCKMKAMAKKMEEGLQGRRRNRWKKT